MSGKKTLLMMTVIIREIDNQRFSDEAKLTQLLDNPERKAEIILNDFKERACKAIDTFDLESIIDIVGEMADMIGWTGAGLSRPSKWKYQLRKTEPHILDMMGGDESVDDDQAK